ncbi:right-handed parallel beta-helix repeat-containing protein, partial [Myxococcota bacterium]|nr:right-handed parallel beta-helix repeat-containing protein [Myxococcota bacterium]
LARWPNSGQTDTVAQDYPATVAGDIFGTATTFDYMGSTGQGNADDGYPNYTANVGGTDYYLYHCTWEWGGATHRYWFLSTQDPTVNANCWPDAITSWLGAGEEEIPALASFGGSAAEEITARNTPVDNASGGFLRIPEVLSDTTFTFPGDRHLSWGENQLFVQGLLGNYWADDTLESTIAGSTVTLTADAAYGINARQPFFMLNVLEELDEPGEYYVDRTRGVLYFWPPGEMDTPMEVTVAQGPLISMTGASHIHFSGFTLQSVRGSLAKVSGAQDITFGYMTFQNAGLAALSLEGSDSGVYRSMVRNTGDMGIQVRCGDRSTLEKGNCFVEDTEVKNFSRWNRTYSPAIRLEGCGNRVLHNHLHSAPHTAILFSGNDHRIAFNIINNVVSEANDAGAIYTGRDFGYRGNTIEFNYIHHINSLFGGSHGVYLDDAVSGITVRSNIIHTLNGLATQSGGGRDNIFEYNIIVNAREGAHATDRRAQAKNNDLWSGENPDSWNLLGRLSLIFESYLHGTPLNHRTEPWSSAYPALAAVPADYADVEGTHWLDPEGSVFARNLVWQTESLFREGTWGGEGALACYADTTENLVDQDPLFTDEANGDLSLSAGSPAYTIPGFVPIDFASIGIRP